MVPAPRLASGKRKSDALKSSPHAFEQSVRFDSGQVPAKPSRTKRFACWTSAAVVTSYAMGVGRMRSENRLCHRGKRRERLIALPLGWMLAFAAQEIRTAATHLATGA